MIVGAGDAAQLGGDLPSIKWGMVTGNRDPELQRRRLGSGVQGHPQLHSELRSH